MSAQTFPKPSEMVVDLFAGGGGMSCAIEQAGFSVDVAINHNAEAIAMHTANHSATQHYVSDVFEVDPRQATRGCPVGLLHASPDCFPAGTLVLTSNGYYPIEAVQVGDLVLTHRGHWRPVTATMTAQKPLMTLSGYGHPGLRVSAEHPVFLRRRSQVWDNAVRQYRPTYTEAQWIPARAIAPQDYWATPVNVETLPIPALPIIAQGTHLPIDERLMWLAGHYLGNGWTRITSTRAELVITTGKHKADAIAQSLNMWPRQGSRVQNGELAWHHRETRTSIQSTANSRSLALWLREQFGHLAHHKRLPGWVFGMPASWRTALLNGYMAADGYHGTDDAGKDVRTAATVSPALAFGLKTLICGLGKSPTVYLRTNNTHTIEGRNVYSRPLYSVRWRHQLEGIRDQTFVADNLRWAAIKKIMPASTVDPETVFNLSVQDDESYVAEGIVVHNCTDHSQAKGGQPRRKKIRALSWVVARWAGQVRPRIITLENVKQIQAWGPLIAKRCPQTGLVIKLDGTVARPGERVPIAEQYLVPDPKRTGQTWKAFVRALTSLGYRVEWRLLCAADYGAPTTRERLFLAARCDGEPIVWPTPTHAKVASSQRPRWRAAAECMDWSLPCPSIFTRSKPLADATLRRIAKGIQKYVLESGDPFIVPIARYHAGQDTCHSVTDPLKTITASPKGGAFSVCAPTIVPMTHQGSDRVYDIKDPLRTVTGAHRGEIAMASAYLMQANGGFNTTVGRDSRDPMTTITNTGSQQQLVTAHLAHLRQHCDARDVQDPLQTISAGGEHHALVAAFLSRQFGNSVGHAASEPLGTTTAGGGGKSALVECTLSPRDAEGALRVAAFLMRYYSEGGQWGDLRDPVDTITTKDRLALVTVTIQGVPYIIVDIGLRMLTPRELYRAQGFPDSYVIDRDYQGRPLSKSAQVRMVGNSVSPPPATALISANFTPRRRAQAA